VREPDDSEIAGVAARPSAPAKPKGSKPAPTVTRAAKPAAPPLTPLAPIARREKQHLVRGRAKIDARLDLHGSTQAEAHAALAHFLRGAQRKEAKFVLVITGKSGVLRRQVPQWLRLPELREVVVGFEEAHAAHGGEGALYVRIRRERATE
jgi:DNA-nicking Smr family endonuclease